MNINNTNIFTKSLNSHVNIGIKLLILTFVLFSLIFLNLNIAEASRGGRGGRSSGNSGGRSFSVSSASSSVRSFVSSVSSNFRSPAPAPVFTPAPRIVSAPVPKFIPLASISKPAVTPAPKLILTSNSTSASTQVKISKSNQIIPNNQGSTLGIQKGRTLESAKIKSTNLVVSNTFNQVIDNIKLGANTIVNKVSEVITNVTNSTSFKIATNVVKGIANIILHPIETVNKVINTLTYLAYEGKDLLVNIINYFSDNKIFTFLKDLINKPINEITKLGKELFNKVLVSVRDIGKSIFNTVTANYSETGLRMAPVLGEAIDLVEFDSGKDIVTEESLSKDEKAVTLVGFVAVGVSAKAARDYLKTSKVSKEVVNLKLTKINPAPAPYFDPKYPWTERVDGRKYKVAKINNGKLDKDFEKLRKSARQVIKNTDDILNFAKANKISQHSSGSVFVVKGTFYDALDIMISLEKNGWKYRKNIAKDVITYDSPDKKFTISLRQKAISKIPDMKHNATIDVMELNLAGNLVKGSQKEIKFAE